MLGVDPAAAGATGYGVIESDGRRCRMLRFGALRATRKGPEHFPERLREIHAVLAALIEEFQPHGVAVVVEGAHECMTTRGVRRPDVTMVTSRMLGVFRNQPQTRAEFLAAIDLRSAARVGKN